MKIRSIMKSRSLLCAASLILLALTMCQCNDDDRVGELEELPEEIAANLKVVPNTDLLISMPPFEVRKPVATATPKNCASTELSYVQVIFPITICYPPDFSTNGLLKEYRLAPDREPFPPPAGQTQTYTLSSFDGKALRNPLFCVQKGGPWLATISRTDPCFGPIEFNLAILGVPACPQCPAFRWFDDLDNHPPELHLIMPLVDTTVSYLDCDPTDPTKCGPDTNPTPAPPPAIWSGK
jgi:hypothetical protein